MKNSALIILVIAVAGGFFGWQLLQSKNKQINCLSNGNSWVSGECINPPAIDSVENIDTATQEPEGVIGDNTLTELSEKSDRYDIFVADMDTFETSPAKDAVITYLEQQINEFKSSANNVEDTEFTFLPWTLEFSFEVHNAKNISTVLVRSYEYTGGAHPNTSVQSFSYDVQTYLPLKITEIIISPDVLFTLAALADKELDIDFPEGVSGNDPENWSTWYSDDVSVTFVFSPYQIAAYARGEQEFSVVTNGNNAKMFNQKYFASE
jgi:hypothetical protein